MRAFPEVVWVFPDSGYKLAHPVLRAHLLGSMVRAAYTNSCRKGHKACPASELQGEKKMLQQIRIPRPIGGLQQLSVDSEGIGGGQQVHIDIVRLNAARYIVIFLGAAMLLSLVVQALWLGGDVTLSRVLKVGLVAILGPSLLWAASGKELNLLRELQKRNSQLDQRVMENRALNRMTQAHLAECLPLTRREPWANHGSADNFKSWPPMYVEANANHVLVDHPGKADQFRRYREAVATASAANSR